jgi:hypothetical protein
MTGVVVFERSAEVDEGIFHVHWCGGCQSGWLHHNEDCLWEKADLLCPICEDSGDEEVRGRG